ncbi:MAG TPA: hypothetical protein VNO31_15440 [Umezawaea sp.]|nr:hypothetical protein [Umezawaea sp.]
MDAFTSAHAAITRREEAVLERYKAALGRGYEYEARKLFATENAEIAEQWLKLAAIERGLNPYAADPQPAAL